MPLDLAPRQVHLDYHNSPLIPDVGRDFDADEFASTLAEARITSVTCFAKCHHGMSYYPTKVGVRHPGLRRDLLGEQVEACHRRGIRVPAYLAVVWDEWAADHHADWLQMDRDGRVPGRAPLGVDGRWRFLCMGSPYVDDVAAQTEEVLRCYPVDGIFLDIIRQTIPGCVCNHCLASMRARGLDPTDDAQLAAHSLQVERAFLARLSALIRSIKPDASIFFNSRLRLDASAERGNPGELGHFTHLEIESLPSGQWGYNHFPLFARYFQTVDRPLLGMTAAFHKSWADFGTVKNQEALDYECFRMAAHGAAVSVGDQLLPRGRLNPETYRRIGLVFGALERKAPWLEGATPLVDIAVLLAPGSTGPDRVAARSSLEGALRMLLESHQQFQFVDHQADLSRYKVVIAPDVARVDQRLAEALRAFLAEGGRLLLTGESGLWTDRDEPALAEAGVIDLGPSEFCPEYLRLAAEFARDVAHDMDHVVYERGRALRAAPGTVVLAAAVRPYFNRTWEHYSSHAQTPPAEPTGFAAVTQRGPVIVCAHPLFRAYRRHGSKVYREIVESSLRRLLPNPIVWTDAPSVCEVTALAQPGRTVVHLLSYVPQRRTPEIDVVEDVLPLRDVLVAVRLPARPSAVKLAPSEEALPFDWNDCYARFSVPEVRGHQMVVVEE
ncbi:MAG: alpha-amylase family protein [Chloroflexota bacterium]